MARRESVSGAVVVVEKYLRANVWPKGLAGSVGEYFYSPHECLGARFYDAYLDSCCFGALVIMVNPADFRVVYVF